MTAAGSEGIAVANIYAAFPDAVDVTPPMDDEPKPTVDVALDYAALGLHVVPIIPGQKRPPMDEWPLHATTDQATIRRWWTVDYKRHGIGIAPRQLPDGAWLFIVDVDEKPGKHGEDTLRDFEDTYGPLPATWTVHSGGGGRHLYFRSPVKLSSGTNKPGPYIDIRGDGGQSVAPPTIHKDTGRPYVWDVDLNPETVPLADAPGWLVELLLPEPRKPRPSATGADNDDPTLPGNRYNAGTTWRELLEPDGWTLSRVMRGGVEGWTRPGKNGRDGISATVGYEGIDKLYVFTGSVPFLPSGKLYSRWAYMTYRDYGGDFSASASAINADPRFTQPVGDWLDEIENTATLPDAPATETPATPTARPTLPDDFWTARPFLEHIQQAARSRLVAPTALLGHVLAYVAAYTPPTYCVPPYIGGNTPLSLFVAQVAHSGGGKSSPARVVDDLLPTLPTVYSLGSGEGLIETYLEEVEERVDGKKIRRKQQTRFGAVFHLDEGAALADMGNRKGSTIFPTLRSAWMGAPIGTANSSQDTRRQLDAAAYSLGVTFLFQPSKARPLFDDVDGGLPQRFLFIEPTDTDAPDIEPDWPGPLPWTPKALSRIEGRVTHHPLNYPAHVADTIRTERKQHLRGQLSVGPLDAHRNLHRLKIAGLFAILDGNRTDVTDDDWTLAGILLDYSDAVRASVLRQLSAEDTRKENAATAKAVTRNRVLSDAEEHRAFDAALRAVARKAAANAGQTFTRGDLSRAVASKHRQLVTMEDVISKAVEKGYLGVTADDRYTLGAKPI